jgi:hypothetical protein
LKFWNRDRRQHLAGVADDQDGADRLPLATLAADLGGQVDDRPQHVQRGRVAEHAQVLRGHPLQVLAQVDDAEAIHRLGGVLQGGDAVVEGDDVRPGLELLLGRRPSAERVHPLLGGQRLGFEVDDRPVRVVSEGPGEGWVLGGDEQLAPGEHAADLVPVDRGFGEQQDGVGRAAS